MRVAILGPLAVEADDGSPVEVPGARLRTLLVLLALDPGRVVSVGALIDGVWDAEPPAEAANALQALVSRLRRAGLTVESGPAGYRLVLAAEDVDVCRFERLAAEGRAALATDPAATARTSRAALALWRGPALADVAGAAFAHAPVARLTELRLTAIGDRIEADLATGQHGGLVAELESLVAEHPLRERFAGLLMRSLAATGRTADALAVFARTKATLADELGADPSAELTTLHLELLRGEPVRPAERRTNLRTGLTSFVGRDTELATVTAMVAESRLVTLIGPGGSGKTRLATEAGRALLDAEPGGVWFVELAPVGDDADVPQAVLGALGLRTRTLTTNRVEAPVEAPVDRLAAALATRSLVLILDNCEHLIGAAAALADRLLGDCPGLRVLATSREPLGITGETLWPVDPLALPPEDADPATALSFPAVRLLADRARAVRPAFATDTGSAATMTRVCRALDGMPLAIELAAARLRTMSLDAVATRLDDRFRLLTGGSRMALPRHQTLRAVVDWSWDLLDDDERTLLRRLSVFAGGATQEAVEQVCAGPGLPADRVLDLLAALVDKSLVLFTGDRYGLLETIKAYGRERLAEAGETERIRDAFVDWFARLAATAEPHLRRAEQLDWLAVLQADHDNLHAAVRAAIASNATLVAMRLLASVGWYWWMHGHKAEGAELAAEVMAMRGEVPDEDRALALALAAMLAIDGLYDKDRATAWFAEAVELVRVHELSHPILRLLVALNEVLSAYERPAEVLRSHLSDILVNDEDPWVLGAARVMRAHSSLNAGRWHEEAEADFRAALAAFRSVGERWGMSFSLCSLADVVAWRGDFATAIEMYEESNALFAELVINEDLVRYRLRLAGLHTMLGRHEQAAAVLAEAEREAEYTGLVESTASVAHARGDLARLAGDLDMARRELTAARELAGMISTRRQRTVAPQFSALIESSLGFLAGEAGDVAAALAHHGEALALALASRDAPVVAQVLVGLADVTRLRGEPRPAAVLLGASEGVRGAPDLSIADYARVADRIRGELGDAEFATAFAQGRTTTMRTVEELTGPALVA